MNLIIFRHNLDLYVACCSVQFWRSIPIFKAFQIDCIKNLKKKNINKIYILVLNWRFKKIFKTIILSIIVGKFVDKNIFVDTICIIPIDAVSLSQYMSRFIDRIVCWTLSWGVLSETYLQSWNYIDSTCRVWWVLKG